MSTSRDIAATITTTTTNCSISVIESNSFSSFLDSDVVVDGFEGNDSIERFHNIPRFGHTNELSDWLADDVEANRDYFVGILAMSICFIVFILLWLSFIVYFKLAGPQQCGRHEISQGQKSGHDNFSAKDSVGADQVTASAGGRGKSSAPGASRSSGIASDEKIDDNNDNHDKKNTSDDGGDDNHEKIDEKTDDTSKSKHSNSDDQRNNNDDDDDDDEEVTTLRVQWNGQIINPLKAFPATPSPKKRPSKARETKRFIEATMRTRYSTFISENNLPIDINEDSSNGDVDRGSRLPPTPANNIISRLSWDAGRRSQIHTRATNNILLTPSAPSANRRTLFGLFTERTSTKSTLNSRGQVSNASGDTFFYLCCCQNTCLRVICIALLVAGFCVATFFNLVGLKNLIKSSLDVAEQLDHAKEAISNGTALTNQFISEYAMMETSKFEFLQTVNGFCPTVTTSICANISSSDPDCDFNGIPFGQELGDLVNYFDGTLDLILGGLLDLNEQLLEVETILDGISKTAWLTVVPLSLTALFSFFLALLCITGLVQKLLRALFCRQKGRLANGKASTCLMRSILLLFLVFFTITLIGSLAMIMAATATADLCFDSPDHRILTYLRAATAFDEKSIVLVFLFYYLRGCQVEDYPIELIQRISTVKILILPELSKFTSLVKANNPDIIFERCGANGSALFDAAANLENRVCLIVQLLTQVTDFFACRNWYPLYEGIAYDDICTDAVDGFALAVPCTVLIIVLALVAFTVRVAT